MGKSIDKKQEDEIRDFIVELSTLKHRASELSMWRTFHLLDDALNHSGWELARLLEQEKEKN